MDEISYLNQYATDLFNHMVKQESSSICNRPLRNHPGISTFMRCYMIDWLAMVNTHMDIQDRAILFQAVNIMDKYFVKYQTPLKKTDL